MRTERPQEGVAPIEQMQVSRAVEKLQGEGFRPEDVSKAVEQAIDRPGYRGEIKSPEDLPESVKAVKSLVAQEGETPEEVLARTRAEIAGFDLEGTGGLLPSADRMMEMQRRMQEQERYYEGSRIAETIRTSTDPEEIVLEVRRELGIIEGNIDDARYNNLSMIARQLQDRAQTFRDAADPRTKEVLKTGLQRAGLIERSVARQERLHRILGRDRWEIDVNDEEKAILEQAARDEQLRFTPNNAEEIREEYPHKLRFNGSQLDKFLDSEESEKIARGTMELKVTPSKTREELLSLAEVCERQAKEVSARQRLFLGYSMYEPARGQIGELAAGLFENTFYSSRITLEEWATLAESGPSLPGERPFGEKVTEVGMRLYCLLGELGGLKKDKDDRTYETFEEKVKATRRLIDKKLMDKVWSKTWLDKYIGDEERQKTFKDELAYHGAKNLFSSGYPQRDAKTKETWQRETRNWVAGWLGQNEADNRAAEELSWRSSFMMGHPSYFDGMTGTVAGAPATADDIKTQHPDNWRDREHGSNHDAGPLATIGKYDKAAKDFGVLGGKFTIMVPFLQYCLPMENANGEEILVGDMESFWGRWWERGESFKDLPLRGFRDYAWQYWLLFPGYFGGGYGHRSQQSYEKNLFWLITNDEWKREPLINIGTLKSIFRTTKYGLGGWAVTRGNVQGWLREVNKKPELLDRFRGDIKKTHDRAKQEWEREGRKGEFKKFLIEDKNTGRVRVKQRVEELNASEFEEVVVNPLRQRVRELILVGAITSDYQTKGRVGGYLEWGILRPGNLRDLLQLKNVLIGVRLSAQDQGATDEAAGMVLKRTRYLLNKSKFDVNWDRITKEVQSFLGSTGVEL